MQRQSGDAGRKLGAGQRKSSLKSGKGGSLGVRVHTQTAPVVGVQDRWTGGGAAEALWLPGWRPPSSTAAEQFARTQRPGLNYPRWPLW